MARTGMAWQGCDVTHGTAHRRPHRLRRMEWMLQVADELDDAVGALRLYFCGWSAGIAMVAAAAAATAQREVRFQRRKII